MKGESPANDLQTGLWLFKLNISKKSYMHVISIIGRLFQFYRAIDLHRAIIGRPLSATSSCHVTSYLLGPRGRCISDWQGFDAMQNSNNPRACRRRRITAWWNPAAEAARESEQRGRRGGRGSRWIQTFHLLSFLHVKIRDKRSPFFLESLQICQLFLPSFSLTGDD